MALLDFFKSKDDPIKTYEDFWAWFGRNERMFFKVVKDHKNIEKSFFDKLSPRLAELKDGYFYLTGMFDDNTAELILTAEVDEPDWKIDYRIYKDKYWRSLNRFNPVV